MAWQRISSLIAAIAIVSAACGGATSVDSAASATPVAEAAASAAAVETTTPSLQDEVPATVGSGNATGSVEVAVDGFSISELNDAVQGFLSDRFAEDGIQIEYGVGISREDDPESPRVFVGLPAAARQRSDVVAIEADLRTFVESRVSEAGIATVDQVFEIKTCEMQPPEVAKLTDPSDYISLAVEEAGTLADSNGTPWRVTRIDGINQTVTLDLLPGRLNFHTENGEVIEVIVEETPENSATPPEPPAFTVSQGAPLGEAQGQLEPGEVRLWVSNQSFTDERVGVTVIIDGTVGIDDWFDVEGQHNWISFDLLGLSEGGHTLVAESTTGAVLNTEFVTSETEPRWLLLEYWNSPDDPAEFTFDDFDEPIAFN